MTPPPPKYPLTPETTPPKHRCTHKEDQDHRLVKSAAVSQNHVQGKDTETNTLPHQDQDQDQHLEQDKSKLNPDLLPCDLEARRHVLFGEVLDRMMCTERSLDSFNQICNNIPNREQYGNFTYDDYIKWRNERDDGLIYQLLDYINNQPELTDELLRDALTKILKGEPQESNRLFDVFGDELRLYIGRGKQFEYRVLLMSEEDYFESSSKESSRWIAPYIAEFNHFSARPYFALSDEPSAEPDFVGIELGTLEYSANPENDESWEPSQIRFALGRLGGSVDGKLDGVYLIDPESLKKAELGTNAWNRKPEAVEPKPMMHHGSSDTTDSESQNKHTMAKTHHIVLEDLGLIQTPCARLATTINALIKGSNISLTPSSHVPTMIAYMAYYDDDEHIMKSLTSLVYSDPEDSNPQDSNPQDSNPKENNNSPERGSPSFASS